MSLKRGIDAVEGRKLLQDAATIQASSTIESEAYSTVFPSIDMDKVEHLPNGIDTSIYRPDAVEPGEFRASFDLSGKTLLLFLGRLNEIKRPYLLLKAFEAVADDLPDTKLVFVGPDEGERPTLEKSAAAAGISDDVVFTGPLYNDAKLEVFVDADVFVLPSRYDSFSEATLEAIACRLPVVLSESVGVVEYLDGNCRTFETQVELQEHLSELATDATARERLAEAGYQHVRDHLAWNEVGHRIVSMYERAIDRHEA